MGPGRGPRPDGSQSPRPRTALVLGAGGVLGAAWMTGALPAVQQLLPCPINDVDVIVGTSAGSVLAAALRCGASVGEMVAFQRGEAVGALAGTITELTSGAWPPLPRLRVGSARLALSMLVAPRRVHPWVGACGLLPRGRGTHLVLRDMVHALHCHAYRGTAPGGLPDWVGGGQTWIVTVDYDSGERVIFGRPGAPPARLSEAVVASCSIPGWYEPAVIGGRRYIDGGVLSATSLDALAQAGIEEAWVLAPMASLAPDRPRKPHQRLERRLRAWITRELLRDVQALQATGTRVMVITPGPEDLAVLGLNLMDPRRRTLVLETSLRTSGAAAYSAGEPEVA